MYIEQQYWRGGERAGLHPSALPRPAQVVLVFGAPARLRDPACYPALTATYPQAHILGCSTAGEIYDTQVLDDSVVVTAVHFEHTQVRCAQITLATTPDSFAAGAQLAAALRAPDLVHLFVLSEGLQVNGSALVEGLVQHLPPGLAVTGGLAGDGAQFGQTFVCLDGPPQPGIVAALGLYGARLRVGYGSQGGWDSFGPDRLISRAHENVLYELDGQSALSLYKTYLAEQAAALPASGLLYPLSLRTPTGEMGVVRTLLAINEQDQSLTFAGDVPQGSYARLMKANFERLIEGAEGAAQISAPAGTAPPDLAILISCVGRKLLLQQRIEEEVESVRAVLGEQPVLTGFYSYGEISPFTPAAKCELHNQTMTITTFAEI